MKRQRTSTEDDGDNQNQKHRRTDESKEGLFINLSISHLLDSELNEQLEIEEMTLEQQDPPTVEEQNLEVQLIPIVKPGMSNL